MPEERSLLYSPTRLYNKFFFSFFLIIAYFLSLSLSCKIKLQSFSQKSSDASRLLPRCKNYFKKRTKFSQACDARIESENLRGSKNRKQYCGEISKSQEGNLCNSFLSTHFAAHFSDLSFSANFSFATSLHFDLENMVGKVRYKQYDSMKGTRRLKYEVRGRK